MAIAPMMISSRRLETICIKHKSIAMLKISVNTTIILAAKVPALKISSRMQVKSDKSSMPPNHTSTMIPATSVDCSVTMAKIKAESIRMIKMILMTARAFR